MESSAALGRQLAALLDPLQPVKGITTGKVNPELKPIGVITKRGTGILPVNPHGQDGHATEQIDADSGDLAVTAGWAHAGRGGITVPAGGKVVERGYTADELAPLPGPPPKGREIIGAPLPNPPPAGEGAYGLGQTTCDIYLNDNVCWRNIPQSVEQDMPDDLPLDLSDQRQPNELAVTQGGRCAGKQREGDGGADEMRHAHKDTENKKSRMPNARHEGGRIGTWGFGIRQWHFDESSSGCQG